MKKKAFKRKRNILNVLAVLVMLMATLLTACSSGKTDVAPASEETSAAEADKEAEQVKEEAVEPEPTAEPTPEPEPTAEPTPEAVVYEGIDMESTLPGLEWMATFDEIVNEPLIVVYNDDTNKKVIVNEGDEVEFSRSSDVLALYTPNNETMTAMTISGKFNKDWIGSNELPDSTTSKRVIMCKKGSISGDSEEECGADVMINGELQRYKFVLKFVD